MPGGEADDITGRGGQGLVGDPLGLKTKSNKTSDVSIAFAPFPAKDQSRYTMNKQYVYASKVFGLRVRPVKSLINSDPSDDMYPRRGFLRV